MEENIAKCYQCGKEIDIYHEITAYPIPIEKRPITKWGFVYKEWINTCDACIEERRKSLNPTPPKTDIEILTEIYINKFKKRNTRQMLMETEVFIEIENAYKSGFEAAKLLNR